MLCVLAFLPAQVIQADGGTRCACINAAMLAVADAGIPCKDLAAACAAGYLQSRPLLDMNYEEDAGCAERKGSLQKNVLSSQEICVNYIYLAI